MSIYEKVNLTLIVFGGIGFVVSLITQDILETDSDNQLCAAIMVVGFCLFLVCAIGLIATWQTWVWNQPDPNAPNPYGGIEVGK